MRVHKQRPWKHCAHQAGDQVPCCCAGPADRRCSSNPVPSIVVLYVHRRKLMAGELEGSAVLEKMAPTESAGKMRFVRAPAPN